MGIWRLVTNITATFCPLCLATQVSIIVDSACRVRIILTCLLNTMDISWCRLLILYQRNRITGSHPQQPNPLFHKISVSPNLPLYLVFWAWGRIFPCPYSAQKSFLCTKLWVAMSAHDYITKDWVAMRAHDYITKNWVAMSAQDLYYWQGLQCVPCHTLCLHRVIIMLK